VADDFNDEGFWDGEEEGYFDEKRFPRVWLLSMGILSVVLVVGVVALAFLALFRPIPTPTPVLSPAEGPALSPSTSLGINSAEGPVLSPTEGPVLSPSTSLGINLTEGPVMSLTEGPVLSLTEGPAPPLSTSVPLPGGEIEVEATTTPVMVQSTPVLPPSTSTPVPAVPQEVAIGVYVKVSGTGGGDLSFRAGPDTNYARLKIVAEGSVLRVLDGPMEADGYIWWQLQDVSDGVVGWAVADYLEPTVP
jgi:hypothetical protein